MTARLLCPTMKGDDPRNLAGAGPRQRRCGPCDFLVDNFVIEDTLEGDKSIEPVPAFNAGLGPARPELSRRVWRLLLK